MLVLLKPNYFAAEEVHCSDGECWTCPELLQSERSNFVNSVLFAHCWKKYIGNIFWKYSLEIRGNLYELGLTCLEKDTLSTQALLGD